MLEVGSIPRSCAVAGSALAGKASNFQPYILNSGSEVSQLRDELSGPFYTR